MDSEFIQLKKVSKFFGKNTVLDSIDLDIPEKKITGIIGASGEGKTTILKLLIGFYKPSKGDVLYLRRSMKGEKKNIERYFGFATEEGSFYEKLTVLENLFHFGRLYSMKKSAIKSRSEELINLVGLQKAVHTQADNLSIGMKKRLDVACSIIHSPLVLIMDEPTADLDPLLRNQMLDLIKKINERGTTIILTTQLLGEMDRICDKVAILFNEKIVEQGSPNKIKSKYGKSTLGGVFEKIFSKRIRKAYSESTKEKTKFLKPQNKFELKEKKKWLKLGSKDFEEKEPDNKSEEEKEEEKKNKFKKLRKDFEYLIINEDKKGDK